jgi:ribonuclease BN (tRNA processing enzyme)
MQVSAAIRIIESRIEGTVEDIETSREVVEGEAFRDDNVRVTSLVNQHFRIAADTEMGRLNKSLGFAFEFGDQRIVFTGDTGPFGRLVEFTRGADILVAEMASYADRAGVPPHIVPHMDHEHLSPTEVGRLAERAGVRVLILSHIGSVGEADVAEIRRNFSGEVIVGQDMATFVLN